jgi:hypothetical protein
VPVGDEILTYENLRVSRRIRPGLEVRFRLQGGQPLEDLLGEGGGACRGEVVAAMFQELAVRIWTSPADMTLPTAPGSPLQMAVYDQGSVYLGEGRSLDRAAPGDVLWVEVAREWRKVDRRRSFRVQVDVPVEIWLPGHGLPVLRHTLDLSETGLRVHSLPAAPGEIVQVRLGLAPVAHQVQMEARVVRHGESAGQNWTALDFVDPDPADRERIRRFLFHEEARLLASRLRAPQGQV